MTRFAILSDIHGNLPALDAVLSDIHKEPFDAVYCLAARGETLN